MDRGAWHSHALCDEPHRRAELVQLASSAELVIGEHASRATQPRASSSSALEAGARALTDADALLLGNPTEDRN